MRKRHRRGNQPSQRIASGFERVANLAEKLNEAVNKIRDHIDDDKVDPIIIFEMRGRRLMMRIFCADGNMGSEKFSAAVQRIIEEAEIPELEAWAEAFEQSAKRLRAHASRVRKHPEKYLLMVPGEARPAEPSRKP